MRSSFAALGALVCSSALAAAACGPAPATVVAPASAPHPAPVATAAPVAPSPLTPAQIAARATPSVVSIRSPTGLGTGFVVRKEGWIATNLHVVAGARALIVATTDRRELPVVEILGIDEVHDLALIRVEATDLGPLVLGDSGTVHAGDTVVAIGHPLGLEDTVSNGLVSAVRVVDPSMTILQISAPIAPGSSGGPLFSDRGEVIGVATAILTQGQNLNFGMPARYLRELLGDVHPVPFAVFAATSARDPELPSIHREVPHHDLALLGGCGEGELVRVARTLDEAIEVGAPAYNEHHFAACYHVYEGAALDLEKRLPATCKGPKKALRFGLDRAAKLDDPSAQAWAMRDAFDGLLDVISRKLGGR